MAPVIITLEALHQHVLELAGDLPIEWLDDVLTPTADHKARTVAFHAIKSETA
jgi:hypothetical protein